MFDLKNLYCPRSPEEAVRVLAETEGTGLYVAGGTILVPTGSPALDYLVDLTGAGLDHIRTEEGPDGPTLVVGATVTMADVAASSELSSPAFRAVREAALEVGTHTVRNRATVGGNIFAAHFPSDLPGPFLILRAALRLLGPGGARDVSLEDFYLRRADVHSKGDLITEVRVPAPAANVGSAFEKTGRTKIDVAIVNCAAAVALVDGAIDEARVVLNGVSAVPYVAGELGGFLEGKVPSDEVFREAGAMVSGRIAARDDHRASGEYRRKVAGVLVARALTRACSREI